MGSCGSGRAAGPKTGLGVLGRDGTATGGTGRGCAASGPRRATSGSPGGCRSSSRRRSRRSGSSPGPARWITGVPGRSRMSMTGLSDARSASASASWSSRSDSRNGNTVCIEPAPWSSGRTSLIVVRGRRCRRGGRRPRRGSWAPSRWSTARPSGRPSTGCARAGRSRRRRGRGRRCPPAAPADRMISLRRAMPVSLPAATSCAIDGLARDLRRRGRRGAAARRPRPGRTSSTYEITAMPSASTAEPEEPADQRRVEGVQASSRAWPGATYSNGQNR